MIEVDLANLRTKARNQIIEYIGIYTSAPRFLEEGEMGIYTPVGIPRMVFADDSSGVGIGDGETGWNIDPYGTGDKRIGISGSWQPTGGDSQPVFFNEKELAEILGKALELPDFRERFGKRNQQESHVRGSYKGSRTAFRRAYLSGLARGMAFGDYDPENPMVILDRKKPGSLCTGKRRETDASAVIVYLIDGTGSMRKYRDIAEDAIFWTTAWVKKHYPSAEIRFVWYAVSAEETDKERILSETVNSESNMVAGFELAAEIIGRLPEKNSKDIYVFHISDGDYIFSKVPEEETRVRIGRCVQNRLVPFVNGFFGLELTVEKGSRYYTLMDYLRNAHGSKIRIASIESRREVARALGGFFK